MIAGAGAVVVGHGEFKNQDLLGRRIRGHEPGLRGVGIHKRNRAAVEHLPDVADQRAVTVGTGATIQRDVRCRVDGLIGTCIGRGHCIHRRVARHITHDDRHHIGRARTLVVGGDNLELQPRIGIDLRRGERGVGGLRSRQAHSRAGDLRPCQPRHAAIAVGGAGRQGGTAAFGHLGRRLRRDQGRRVGLGVGQFVLCLLEMRSRRLGADQATTGLASGQPTRGCGNELGHGRVSPERVQGLGKVQAATQPRRAGLPGQRESGVGIGVCIQRQHQANDVEHGRRIGEQILASSTRHQLHRRDDGGARGRTQLDIADAELHRLARVVIELAQRIGQLLLPRGAYLQAGHARIDEDAAQAFGRLSHGRIVTATAATAPTGTHQARGRKGQHATHRHVVVSHNLQPAGRHTGRIISGARSDDGPPY